MVLPSPSSAEGKAGLAAIVSRPAEATLALDFDGVIAPIVADPADSRPFPGVIATLHRLTSLVGSVSIVTGRAVAHVMALGDFGALAEDDRFGVFGLYGLQRWDPQRREVVSAVDAPGVPVVRRLLPGVIAAAPDSAGVVIEDKGMSLAVHTRRADRPEEAFAALRGPLIDLAAANGLAMEPGRFVLELRPPGVNKGNVVSGIAERRGAKAVAYFGDDLGDLAAFDAVDALRADGVAGLKVCSGSDEVPALKERADLVVDGPPGVAAFLTGLAGTLEG
ncbi:trehalose-phosphatase [Dactylosporangium sp. CA-092794]|uniref:trehalose-phosphatase n=1 Tax=Dactylosporangium sp. CA-092794 TaxID=3239929 RepID=UPI003D8AE975